MARRQWALILGIALAGPVVAQDAAKPNLAARGTGAQGGVAQLAFAQQLYALAIARRDAQSVLAAARLARSVAVHDIEVAKETVPVEAASATNTGVGVDGPVQAAMMLTVARKLAGNDESILILIDAAEAEQPAGGLTAARAASRLDPGQQDAWKMPFFSGVLAEIAVIGDGDAPLHLRVADENNATVCQYGGPGDTIYCDWVPAWNGYFTVTIANVGSTQNSYSLLTN